MNDKWKKKGGKTVKKCLILVLAAMIVMTSGCSDDDKDNDSPEAVTTSKIIANGEEFILSRADDFASEVEALESSLKFKAFLDERMKAESDFL